MDGFLGLLESKGVEIRENTADPNEYRICCPFCPEMGHSPDFKFRFGFNIESGLGHCFNCNYVSRKAALDLIRIFGGSEEDIHTVRQIRFTKETRKRPEKVEFPDGFEYLKDVEADDDVFGEALRYVQSRGITKQQIKEKEIGATIVGRYGYRIVFPVRTERGKLVGMVGRDWTGKTSKFRPKYLNSKGTKSFYNARPDLYPHRLAIGSEGITKSLAIERATRYKLCSFAFLGIGIRDVQTIQLNGFKEIVIFPDPEKAGVVGALHIAANLVSLHEVSIVWPWPEIQADDMTEKEIRKRIRNRRRYNTLLEWEVKRIFKDIL